jgi:MFS family permease
MRVMQGAAIGGEMPGAWVFVAEHAPQKRYGFAIGALTSGITGGIFLGSIIGVWLNSTYSQGEIHDWAWRCPSSWAVSSVWCRCICASSCTRPHLPGLQARKAADRELPIKTILRDHREACVVVALMTWVLSTAIVVVILFTPPICKGVPHRACHGPEGQCRGDRDADHRLRVLGLAVRQDRHQADHAHRLGRHDGHGLSVLSEPARPGVADLQLCDRGLLRGLHLAAAGGGRAGLPAEVRFTGLSFSYNMAYAVFGGLTPMLVSVWQQVDVMAPAHYVAAMGVLGMAMGFWPLACKGWQPKVAKA